MLNGAPPVLMSGWFVYLALATLRLSWDEQELRSWDWRGWRHLRWAQVTRAEVQQIPGGTALILWRHDERWRLTYAHFKDPKAASAFVAQRLPPTVRGLVSAA